MLAISAKHIMQSPKLRSQLTANKLQMCEVSHFTGFCHNSLQATDYSHLGVERRSDSTRKKENRRKKMEKIEDKVLNFIASKRKLPPEVLTLDTRFIDDLGIDSMGVMELAMDLEQEFKIQFPDESMNKLRSVGDVIAVIKAYRSE
jgi:acyl carrier protein